MAVHEILKMGDARLLRLAQPVPSEALGSASRMSVIFSSCTNWGTCDGAITGTPLMLRPKFLHLLKIS